MGLLESAFFQGSEVGVDGLDLDCRYMGSSLKCGVPFRVLCIRLPYNFGDLKVK